MDSCLADIFDPGNTPGTSGSIGSPAYAGFILTEGGEGGVRITADLAASNTFSAVISVPPGTPTAILATGTWAGTLTIEYALGPTGPWLVSENFTGNFYWETETLAPRWGRVGFEAGAYTSGTAHVALWQPPGNTIAIESGGAIVGAIQLEGSS